MKNLIVASILLSATLALVACNEEGSRAAAPTPVPSPTPRPEVKPDSPYRKGYEEICVSKTAEVTEARLSGVKIRLFPEGVYSMNYGYKGCLEDYPGCPKVFEGNKTKWGEYSADPKGEKKVRLKGLSSLYLSDGVQGIGYDYILPLEIEKKSVTLTPEENRMLCSVGKKTEKNYDKEECLRSLGVAERYFNSGEFSHRSISLEVFGRGTEQQKYLLSIPKEECVGHFEGCKLLMMDESLETGKWLAGYQIRGLEKVSSDTIVLDNGWSVFESEGELYIKSPSRTFKALKSDNLFERTYSDEELDVLCNELKQNDSF